MGTLSELVALVILVFLFWGEPDPYDRLHDYVMALGSQRVEVQAPKAEKREVNGLTLRRE
jgi:hypothetical protein